MRASKKAGAQQQVGRPVRDGGKGTGVEMPADVISAPPKPRRTVMVLPVSDGTRAAQQGFLSEDEVETLRAAYAGGARGSVLIGLRQVVRALSVLLPEAASEAAGAGQMAQAGARLRRLGCDGYVHARRARVRLYGSRSGTSAVAALLIDQRTAPRLCSGTRPTIAEPGEDEQRVLLLARFGCGGVPSPAMNGSPSSWRLRGAARLRDAISEALDQVMDQGFDGALD